jgi:hypothetical protein
MCELPDEDLRDLEAWHDALAIEATQTTVSTSVRGVRKFDAARIFRVPEAVLADE